MAGMKTRPPSSWESAQSRALLDFRSVKNQEQAEGLCQREYFFSGSIIVGSVLCGGWARTLGDAHIREPAPPPAFQLPLLGLLPLMMLMPRRWGPWLWP